MSERNYTFAQDLREAKAMADGLDTYVRGDDLYGRTGGGGLFGGSRMPSLTVGALLMRLRRLRAMADQLTPDQQQMLEAVEARHAEVRREWTLHYTEKMVREAHSRLDAMRHFFEECAQNARQCEANYPPEALRRTIVQELAGAIDEMHADSNNLAEKIKGADARLRRYVQPAGFQWDATLEPAYPQDSYWWLYARPEKV